MPSIVDGKEVFGFRNQQQTDILTDRAIHFVRRHREKPFFLFFNPFVTHQGYWSTVPDEDLARYRDKPLTVPDLSPFPEAKMTEEELRRLMRVYYGAITCADRNLGRLLAALDDLSLARNTMFIFMADNGMNLGQHGLIGKGNASVLGSKPPIYRPNMFDHSVLVPFIVRWPGVVKAGAASDAFVSTIDILPTLMAEAGAGAGQNPKLDGRSLLPLLKRERGVEWREAYSDTYDMIYLDESHMRMIRTDRWKLVLHFDADGRPQDGGKHHELFDLQSDPEELVNLYGQPSVAEIQERLDEQLHVWMRGTGVTN